MSGITEEDIVNRLKDRPSKSSTALPWLILLLVAIAVGFMAWYFKPQIKEYTTKTFSGEPVLHTFVTLSGQKITGNPEGYDSIVHTVKISTAGSFRYLSAEDLTPADRKFAETLPQISVSWPVECMVSDSKGKLVRIKALRRVENFIVLNDTKTDTVDFRPESYFSAEDQRFFNAMDASPLPRYPFKMTLTDNTGRYIPAVVLGRTDINVDIVLENGVNTQYPINKLSQANQDFLRQLASKFDSVTVKRLKDNIEALELQNIKLQAAIADPSTSPGQRDISKLDYERNKKEIYADQLKIQAEQKAADIANHKNADQGNLP